MTSSSDRNALGGTEDERSATSTDGREHVVIHPPPPPPPPIPEPPPVVIDPASKPPPSPKEATTNILAYVLILSFFVIAGVPLIAIFWVGGDTMATKTNTAIEWLKGVSAYLAGLIGAVIGYYFRAETAQRS